jgi:hypothetical protein
MRGAPWSVCTVGLHVVWPRCRSEVRLEAADARCVVHLGLAVIQATGMGRWLTVDWPRLSDLMAG